MTRRGWGVGIVGAFVCLVVAACGADPGPVVTPSPSVTPTEVAATVSPSPTPTPSPSATVLTEEEVLAAIPEDARYEDYPSSVAFAEYFLQVSQRAFVEGDARHMWALADPSCQYCSHIAAVVEQVAADGVSVTGGDLRRTEQRPVGGLQPDGTWRVGMEVQISERTFVNAEGTVLDSTEPQVSEPVIVMAFVDGTWRVIDVGAEADT
ncbi:DUF6318 family protein [Demequina sp.]|uniref:DUF6318 family protein n=1 Tax=Demequina sp. TaxID=2050685 RepID=UPI003A88AC22